MQQTGIKPQVINEIQCLAEKYDLERVILFGSRARGDYGSKSDIDLAVIGGRIDEFAACVNEDTSTLLEFDIVDLNKDVHKSLLNSIESEGAVIYEKV